MKECFYWLADMVIIHAMLSLSKVFPARRLVPLELWKDGILFGAVESEELRARISCNLVSH